MRTPFQAPLADPSLSPSLTAPRYRISPSAAVSPPTLSGIRRDVSGGVRLTLKGAAGSPFTLERSTDLLRWETWIEGTLQETDAAGREFLDDSTSLTTSRFSRARPQ